VRTTSEKAQRAIPEVALSRFCKRGYLLANIEEIGVQTGLTSVGALRHFRSKADLLKVVVDPVRRPWAQLLVVRPLDDPGTVRLRRLMTGFAELFLAHRGALPLLANAISAHLQISQDGLVPLAEVVAQ